ncbi:hypothetical protein NDK47_19395 [Brevibacillus ruminantium]|uniref:Molybdopterin cofactor biosynthesis MoaD-related C-terminal domain-containing protein n=1 Tax=Brevibacillus ruminantium TaxID=2950604 RepID=A0ABY4WAW0_9BACL|nr:hypothetical protein [Brevibacillus ruminantium]USG64305.1 hypothetical protein NDK47_19395 [Brevibacillus ruminantium]
MVEETLELRGIPLSHLITYLEECGGKRLGGTDNALPITIRGEGWQAEVQREETVTITSRFHVQAVFIHVRAHDQPSFDRLLKQFRMKVLRVGG